MKIEPKQLQKIVDSVTESHKHITVAELNGKYHTKIAVNDQPFDWHCHPNSDELLIVTEGSLRIEFRDGTSHTLEKLDSLHIPKGVHHRTIPLGRAVNLVIEDIDAETVFD